MVVVDPVDRATVYAGSAGGLFRSRDGARSWSRTGFDPEPLAFPPGTLGSPNGFAHEHRIAHFAIDPGRQDFFGNALPDTATASSWSYDIGAHEYT